MADKQFYTNKYLGDEKEKYQGLITEESCVERTTSYFDKYDIYELNLFTGKNSQLSVFDCEGNEQNGIYLSFSFSDKNKLPKDVEFKSRRFSLNANLPDIIKAAIVEDYIYGELKKLFKSKTKTTSLIDLKNKIDRAFDEMKKNNSKTLNIDLEKLIGEENLQNLIAQTAELAEQQKQSQMQ